MIFIPIPKLGPHFAGTPVLEAATSRREIRISEKRLVLSEDEGSDVAVHLPDALIN